MSIKFAILGILSWKASTGYELKKLIEDSSFFYWSGNNNQIYKALLQMQEEELVTSEVIHQDSSPTKKIYSITEEGQKELKQWIIQTPEAPEIKKMFLVQLAWSDMLTDQDLNELLSKYEVEIKNQLIMEQEKSRRSINVPNRSQRETMIWELISDNLISSYKNELEWIHRVRQKVFENQGKEVKNRMDYQMKEIDNKKYIEVINTINPLSAENDILELIALCWEHEVSLLMIHYEVFSVDFFNLKTKVAGNILQKLINYNIKSAALIPEEIMNKGRFREMALETNKGNHFRMYERKDEAETWLLS